MVMMKKSARATAKAKAANISVTLKVRVWVSPKDRRIRIVSPSNLISTVANEPGMRCHKHLYGKLRNVLKGRGKWPEGP